MKVSRKIASGYAFQLLLLFACGAVGWSVMSRMTKIIEFITGPAWETADGCMEFTIQLQAQVLATKEIMAGVHVVENNERLTEARAAAQTAFAQMLGGKLISTELTAPLEKHVAEYNAAQRALLAANSQVRGLIPTVEQPVAELQAIAAAARERQTALVASNVRAKPATKPIEITLGTKLISLDSVLSRTDFPRLRSRIAEILADEEQLLKQQLSGPLGDEKLTTGSQAGQSLRGAYASQLANWHEKLLAIVAQREIWKQNVDTHDSLAHATLAMLPAIEEKTDGLLDEMIPIVASTKHYSRLAIICVIGISLVAAVASCLLITRSITLPLAAVVNSLKDIAQGEGDLTRRLNDSRKDELGELARWFNVFVGKLQGIIQRLADNSRALARSSNTVSETSSDLAGVADETKQRSATVAAAAEEMSINMQNMAGSTQAMSNNIRTVASAVEELNITITEVAKNAERAHGVAGRAQHLAETSNTRVADLGQAADGIGKVIEVIQEIAEQTSLLALNATI
ncbi:MAG TPA: methyl-accepting chemotaxis protein, partial [Pirellulaceae bacterium]|nr:methyl-accepting chemotaxis protein [Pirellulaceae bacterium]